ncbi:MAG: hypothetical protein ACLRZ2_08410 [Veillonella sp.]
MLAKFFCSGTVANNITLGGDLQTPYEFGCRLQRNELNVYHDSTELEQAGIDGIFL